MVKSTYFVLLPCLNTRAIKTHSIKRIESLLRGGLGTIKEEAEVFTPSPRPEEAGEEEEEEEEEGAVPRSRGRLERKVSLQKRKVSAKLSKGPQGGWQVKISRFSTVIGDSYVRLMNGLVERGNLGELAFSATSYTMAAPDAAGDRPPPAFDHALLLKSISSR